MGVAIPIASLALTAIGTGVAVEGAVSAADYQSQVAKNNAVIAQQNANTDVAAGAAAEEQNALKTKAAIGGEIASQASNGLDVNTGSALSVREGTAGLGELSDLTIKNNAARQAYGAETQGANFSSAATADQLTGENQALSSLIGGGSKLASTYQSFQRNGALPNSSSPDFP